jgi:hypothetical protein
MNFTVLKDISKGHKRTTKRNNETIILQYYCMYLVFHIVEQYKKRLGINN